MKKLYFYIFRKFYGMNVKLSQILENATSQGYRSNAIKPLSGLIIICITSSFLFAYINVMTLSIVFSIVTILLIVGFVIGYFYCLFNSPDLLRSEKYILEKTAIEKVSQLGDSFNKGATIVNPDLDYVVVESMKSQEKKELE